MLLGILSDSHNNLPNLMAALEVFQSEGITTLIHCGDLTSPETAGSLGGFRVHLTFGNGDYASGEILNQLRALDPLSTAGMVYKDEIDGISIAAAHGHIADDLEKLILSGNYAYVFRGHSHRHKDEWRGTTRVINPGALGGLHPEDRQVCVVDLSMGKVRFIRI